VATEDRQPRQSETAAPAPQADAALPAASASATLSSKGASRRRFARAGAGATGVLLTLHSQPGMACTYCGISASAAVSAIGQNKTIGTLSHHGPAAVCNGIRPINWTWTSWPPGCSPSDSFGKHFSCKYGSAYANTSCRQIMLGADCDATKMAQYMLAAYLNVLSGRVNFLSIESLRSVWTEWITKGYYAPMAGQKWYANDIVGYLYGTMD
jgi:hypothetical protein